jgi:enterochelin esterase family protein
VLIKDVVPMIDATYRTVPDRDHRALAGLSMGAMQAFGIGFDHLDTFAFLAGFSGAPTDFLFGGNTLDPKTFHNGVLADSAAFNKKVRLLWLGVGEVEDKFMLNGVKAFHDALDHADIHHVFYVSPGTAHEWQTWRRDLSELAPQLFVGVTP